MAAAKKQKTLGFLKASSRMVLYSLVLTVHPIGASDKLVDLQDHLSTEAVFNSSDQTAQIEPTISTVGSIPMVYSEQELISRDDHLEVEFEMDTKTDKSNSNIIFEEHILEDDGDSFLLTEYGSSDDFGARHDENFFIYDEPYTRMDAVNLDDIENQAQEAQNSNNVNIKDADWKTISTENAVYHPTAAYFPNPTHYAAPHSEHHCRMVETVSPVEKCNTYTEKRCSTAHELVCESTRQKNCTVHVDQKVTRKCFNVTEQLCNLALDTADSFYVDGADCNKVNQTLCNVVFNVEMITVAAYECTKVPIRKCIKKWKVLMDETCISRMDLKPESGHRQPSQEVPTQKCYNTPRWVKEKECKVEEDKVCRKLQTREPVPKSVNVCRVQENKLCSVGSSDSSTQRTVEYKQPKCHPVEKQVCGRSSKETLVPVCEELPVNSCTHKPRVNCSQEEEKKFCFVKDVLQYKKVCSQKSAEDYLDQILYYA